MRRLGRKRSDYDYKDHDLLEFGLDRLATVGAICFKWNTIEGLVDTCVALGIEAVHPIWEEVNSRINGVEAKVDLIKACARDSYLYPEAYYIPICETLSVVMLYKKYRDAVVHAKIMNPSSEFAPSFARKGARMEVLVTKEALLRLYEHLHTVEFEMGTVAAIFVHIRTVRGRMGTTPSADEIQRASEEAQSALDRLLKYQEMRKALPQLPEFLEEQTSPPASANPKGRSVPD